MNKLHMRSFWIGAHGMLALVNLLLIPLTGWYGFAGFLVGAVWAAGNWFSLQEESK